MHKNEFKKFNLWTTEAGGTARDTCLISSHGGAALINGMANVNAGITLYFYVPHGYLLRQKHFTEAIEERQKPIEHMNARNAQDYLLAKAQYSTQKKYDAVPQDRRSPSVELYSHFEDFTYEEEDTETPLVKAKADLVTIRRRRFYKNPTLSEVLTTLWQAGYRYTKVYCLFCRGNQNPED